MHLATVLGTARSPAREAEYKSFLDNYATSRRSSAVPTTVEHRLYNARWLQNQKAPKDVEVQVGLSFAFLLVCLVTIGLLLAKFTQVRRVGLRRARCEQATAFSQYIIESGVIGVSGGLFLAHPGRRGWCACCTR
jgi:putative ABC transport system permease protein